MQHKLGKQWHPQELVRYFFQTQNSFALRLATRVPDTMYISGWMYRVDDPGVIPLRRRAVERLR